MSKTNYEKHAELEFKAAGWVDDKGQWKDEMQQLICSQVLTLLKVFSTHGHSGTTAPYAIQLFKKLANFEPIVALTGEDWEWTKVADNMWQNKRCSHVLKDKTRAYDIEGKIFREPDGHCYTNTESKVTVTFPYTPKREYVDRPKKEN